MDSNGIAKKSPYKASWLAQFNAVMWRSWLSMRKEPLLIKVRLLQTVVSNFILRTSHVQFQSVAIYITDTKSVQAEWTHFQNWSCKRLFVTTTNTKNRILLPGLFSDLKITKHTEKPFGNFWSLTHNKNVFLVYKFMFVKPMDTWWLGC